MMTGEKNSSTADHAGRKRRPKCVADAWGYCWTDPPCWWLDDRPTTYYREKANC